MNYTELNLQINPVELFGEMLTYQLGEIGFEMFEETPQGFKGYVQTSNFNHDETMEIIESVKAMNCDIHYTIQEIPWQNWNAEWEKNYQPEIIANKIYVRAEFHEPNSSYSHEIVVQPRMAFGTGHHPTTSQVMEAMLDIDFKNKSLLDMGCGTGILAILGMQLGARSAFAIDNDPNSVDNSIENAQRNAFPQIEVALGSSELLEGKTYDIILANINRNIILNDIDKYAASLNDGGLLITSGYYTSDLSVIKNKAEEMHLEYLQHTSQNDWCCATFKKH
ncbi:MAG: 50S ribosomal protein L11 methyltransferase [Bacteroidota bacterium]